MKPISLKLFAPVIMLAASVGVFSACNKDNGGEVVPAFVPTEPVPETVDLGLPSGTLWSSFNLGASAFAQHGKSYAWGETSSKGHYDWADYSFTKEGTSTTDVKLSKYVTNDGYGEPDGKKVLDRTDDAAYVCLGGAWQIPTEKQCDELSENCTLEIVTLQGVKGVLFTSKIPNYKDKSIFIPFDGRREKEKTLGYNSDFRLWTKELNSTRYARDRYVSTGQPTFEVGAHERCYGSTIRPVSFIPVESLSLGDAASVARGKTLQLNKSLVTTPANASCRSFSWKSSDTSIATVDETGLVTGVKDGTATITVTSWEGVSTTCEVKVTFAVPEAVDLGLPSGTLWGSFDLGASKMGEKGKLFSWGELEPKSDYNFFNYRFYISGNANSNVVYSKYVFDDGETHGEIDGKKQLETVDDAAHFHLGGNWYLPTIDQVKELWNNCDLTQETVGGLKGWKFTSKIAGYETSSIFFISTGIEYNGSITFPDNFYVWTSSLYSTTSVYAAAFTDRYSSITLGVTRQYGISIRPVCSK